MLTDFPSALPIKRSSTEMCHVTLGLEVSQLSRQVDELSAALDRAPCRARATELIREYFAVSANDIVLGQPEITGGMPGTTAMVIPARLGNAFQNLLLAIQGAATP